MPNTGNSPNKAILIPGGRRQSVILEVLRAKKKDTLSVSQKAKKLVDPSMLDRISSAGGKSDKGEDQVSSYKEFITFTQQSKKRRKKKQPNEVDDDVSDKSFTVQDIEKMIAGKYYSSDDDDSDGDGDDDPKKAPLGK
jgi:hypothetical protein